MGIDQNSLPFKGLSRGYYIFHISTLYKERRASAFWLLCTITGGTPYDVLKQVKGDITREGYKPILKRASSKLMSPRGRFKSGMVASRRVKGLKFENQILSLIKDHIILNMIE